MAGNIVDMDTKGLSSEYMAARAALPECVVCERPMRPVGAKARDWPATVAYATTEQCKSCYNRKYIKSLSVAEALKPVKATKARFRGTETVVLRLDLPRAEVAGRWSEEERAAATQVACMALRATPTQIGEAREVANVLEMLGLFDVDKSLGYGVAGDPKSDRFV